MWRRARILSMRLLPLAILMALVPAATAVAADADYDHLPGVALAGDVPWTSAGVFDFTTPTFDTSGFGQDDEIANPAAYLGCGVWGAKTAWVRFTTAVAGNVRVTVDSGAFGVGYDVFFTVYTSSSQRANVADLRFENCHDANKGVGAVDEYYSHGFSVAAGRTIYIQTLSVCAYRELTPYCTGEELTNTSGGPTTLRVEFTPDDADGDAVPDSLDRCPATAGSATLGGCVDSDGDGVADPDDRCPGVRGTDAQGCDADGDGHVGRAHGGGDCDDGNRAIHPGARDVPGNGIDENCDGRDARPPRLRNELAALAIWSPAKRRHVGFAGPFSVGPQLVKGMTVRLRCQGRGCPFAVQTVAVTKRRKALKVGRALVGRRLGAGAKVTLLVLRPGYVGIAKRYVLRGRGRAKVVDLCVPVGDTRPRERCR